MSQNKYGPSLRLLKFLLDPLQRVKTLCKDIAQAYGFIIMNFIMAYSNKYLWLAFNGYRAKDKSFKDKIFQPFFTTKPTGQGTGLGLSLSYDIVKAHIGEIKVESKPEEGATIIITIPI